jgi:hypothetical protein
MLLPVAWLHAAEISPQTAAWFADPPPRYRSWPLYWLNAPLELAAFTYDRPVTAVEIYGNYPDHSVDKAMLYRSAMELYVRGANLMIPHGMWYEPAKMHIPPEFSHRNQRWGAELPAYNQFVGRCSLLLQGGRHVADVGMLYPVVALQAAYRFDVPGLQQPNWGKDAPRWADYLKISDRLTGSVRRDFTFLHPELLEERCRVEGATLRLNNATNWEEYRVVIIPGGKVISWSNLQKIQKFYDEGGRVDVDESAKPFVTRTNARGGKAYFAATPTAGTLQAWDPHTAAMTAADCKQETGKGQEITRVRLVLEPVKSVFLVGLP